MGVITYEVELPTSLPPAKVFKAFVLDFDTLFPKVLPQIFKNVELLEGDGGVGSIKQINFFEGGEFKYMKNKIDVIDKETFTCNFTTIEGNGFSNILEKVTYETKCEPAPGGGTICKRTAKYYTIGDISEEAIKALEEQQGFAYKAVEEYISANPDY